MSVLLLVMAILVVALAALVAARREDRRRDHQRLDRFVSEPVARPRLIEVPEFCVCGRPLRKPVKRMLQLTPEGEKEILVCSVCASLGFSVSLVAAEAERVSLDRQAALAPAPVSASPPDGAVRV